jgi:cyclic beta-1,2-glucan synthetase
VGAVALSVDGKLATVGYARFVALFRSRVSLPPEPDEPVRAELFSVERLEQHAESLAAAQSVTPDPRGGRPLLPRLKDNARALLACYRTIAQAIREERAITPAAEWLVDNFHIVDDQIRQIREDLPAGFYRVLPKLADGPLEGYPRIFGIAWAFVAHTDSRFEPESLRRFVRAYQNVQPLTIGELWAVAITLRIVMVENLRRLADSIVQGRAARRDADTLADALLGLGQRTAAEATLTLLHLEEQPLPTAFAVQLVRRLREQDPDLVPALHWLDARLSAQGTNTDDIVRREHHRQAAMNVTVRNVITSMRLMSAFDWKDFFESVSGVDALLRAESDFGALDFQTRDRYRHAIEDLSRNSRSSEREVASRALALAKGAAASDDPDRARSSDPGYHLLSDGRAGLETELGYRVPLGRWLGRRYRAAALPSYFATLVLLSGTLLALPLLLSAAAGASPLMLLLFVVLALVPASDLAVALANRGVAREIGPTHLSKLELRGGVPPELRTLVVIPALLTSEANAQALVDQLELHYLANPDEELRFALLSDWGDAQSETLPDDESIFAAAAARIARLNELHGPPADGLDRFLLLHRARRWNERERLWMGWERKRGKLHELNRLLRGATDTSFLPQGDRSPAAPPGVRYVITLDADTRLPAGTARALVGTLAHPSNRAHLDPVSGRVTRGHAVLQPRVTPTLPGESGGSWYHRISAGRCGLDPYASAASDVYQDLFGEGSYTGKGIYDVDAFEAALAGRVPENAVLSHDLLEGIFARAGLVSDLTLFEAFPADYGLAMRRHHRWARGDWQLLPWIVGRRSRGVPLLGRWKMIDNLRRTLSAPFALATLVAAWTLAPMPAASWTLFVLAILGVPAILPTLLAIVPRRRRISKRSHVQGVASDLALGGAQIALQVTLLAHQACQMLDAIARTLSRLWLQRGLLEWVPAAEANARSAQELPGARRRMAAPVAVALASAGLVAALRPESWMPAAPFIALWLLSPLVATRVSLLPRAARVGPLNPSRAALLRLTARRTWRFFETFVGPEDNALPPDNFQEDPKPVVAHRTSPTNVGLYLLATVAARDFGWIGLLDAVERLEATLDTLFRMDRFRGHHYNWYDTRTLRPLDPPYVSSVDSGNLAGHLTALAQACLERIDQPLLAPSALTGIGDALALVRESAASLPDRRTQTLGVQHLVAAVAELEAALTAAPRTPAAWAASLREQEALAITLVDIAQTLAAERGDGSGDEALAWSESVAAAVRSHRRDLETLLPWTSHADACEDANALVSTVPTPAEMADRCAAALALISGSAAESESSGALSRSFEEAGRATDTLIGRLLALARRARELRDAQLYGFLLDPTRSLLAIGYRVGEGTLDSNCYDLLASEARLASFVAIAKGDLPASHWFALGRPMTPVERGSALISWSGSMFEYLMPALVMHSPPGSLMEQTHRLVVRRQIRYAATRGVPWGISESAFYARDLEFTYQYSNFGVPGLGLKRGLSEDLVIAPYAACLAAMVDPTASADNLAKLEGLGARGAYGFYEALDYTPERLQESEAYGMVRTYMAHHQAMSIVAIANVLHDGSMRTRFHREPIVKAAELLLQERSPRDVAVARPRAEEVETAAHVRDLVRAVPRRFTTPHESAPRTHLLSNGEYAVMITSAGSGYSRWRDLAVTRWSEDVTRDADGQFVFLRDADTGEVWSAGYQPSGVPPDEYEAIFSEDRAEIRRRDGPLATRLEVVVSSEDQAEVRRVSVMNHGVREREIEFTSYAEIVLCTAAADAAHPVFSKLFVQTEAAPQLNALLATRRPRSAEDPPIWAAHAVAVEGERVGGVQYETDRARFLGRGRGIRAALSVLDGRPLSNTAGSVLDPIFSLRVRARIAPGASARVTFSTVVAGSREAVLDLADKFHDPATFDRVVTLARTEAQVELRHLGVEADEAHLFQRLANRILYADPSLRPSSEALRRASGGARALWPHGISGDLPIVLVRIDDAGDQEIVRQVLRAHEYWRLKQLAVDLVLVNEQGTSYAGDLQAALESLVRTSQSRLGHAVRPAHGRVFILRGDRLTPADRLVLQTAARAVLLSRHGTLDEQVARVERTEEPSPPGTARPAATRPASEPSPRLELEHWNGLGGFAADGREYVTVLGEDQWTPAPWINVVANPRFGFHVSESGSGYTWSLNSRENQLTAWSNDPVSDPPGETFYVRDEESGELWGPTALPIREEAGCYIARHGQGYSRFEHSSRGIGLELLQLVPADDPIKLSRLVIENRSTRRRRISVTAYVEWVLGASRSASASRVITERDAKSGALFARNPWNTEFAGRVAFLDLGGAHTAWTCDRTEFLGRNGSLEHPLALERGGVLSGRAGAGIDPCGALQTTLELRPGTRATLVCLLGEGATAEEAAGLVAAYRKADPEALLQEIAARWDHVLGTVQVTTPDRPMDLLLNRWLLYQTLACRVWARSAFYQAGGAFGFRDQLQDVMALAVSKPALAREHLLRASSRQFVEGDVQHWWHPPSGRGTRTRTSDDLLWLPYAAAHYLDVTQDETLLDETVPFLKGPLLAPDQDEAYFEPAVAEEQASFFEHCARALDRSLAVGSHGLPLMGTGDWNDGMNRVGREGKGESVWLGWFLHATLSKFAGIALRHGEPKRAEVWRRHAGALARALESEGWDGDWYRRAYFDDGTPLGSIASQECRIDSIAQSWAVLSGAGDPGRAVRAMAAVEEYLVHRGDGLILLFAPPFDQWAYEPGYIKGYPPGVRENGGQYSHAAVWCVISFAALGDGDKAGELFAILNPINHTSTRAGVHRYKVEPYVAAADVYAGAPHVGRGGWTWYTGSAGWMYRAGMESILGFRFRAGKLVIDPCIPRAWPGFQIRFRYHGARYEIRVENPNGVMRGVSHVELDGEPVTAAAIALSDDGATHHVRVVLG